jgi:hypothetical protein
MNSYYLAVLAAVSAESRDEAWNLATATIPTASKGPIRVLNYELTDTRPRWTQSLRLGVSEPEKSFGIDEEER